MDKITDVAGNAIRGGGSYDGGVYITVIVLVGLLGLAAVYVWKIAIPNSVSARENSEKLTEATIAISTITGDTYKATMASAAKTDAIERDVSRALSCLIPAICALEKIAKTNPSLDIASELGEMKGAIKSLDRH